MDRFKKTWNIPTMKAWLIGASLACGSTTGFASQISQAVAALRVDASAPTPPTAPADYLGGTDRTPNGSVLGVKDRYLTLNGKPWLPVIGELHYSRIPESEWEEEILKMKSAGVNVISTYVIWIHHEEVEGHWDWKGQRDLRHFAELCRKHDMLLYPRIGPWAHAEVRNGGLPDWVIRNGPVRQLDPKFISETQNFYNQIGEQLRGLLWKDGGPVIGVQIENEYGMRGPGMGEEYILVLKKLAIQSGLDVPLYTVTGWDQAVVPPHEVLPVYGGYPDAPWGLSRTKLAPQEVYAFRFSSRVAGNMGMIGTATDTAPETNARSEATKQAPRTPFLTAETGAGIEDTYHRRPVVNADDIAAMMPVMLGSGVNGYGTYMFHGGENPDGRLSSLQESQATHYPTDVPEKSYDFQAPISEFGIERKSLRALKVWNYFLNDFGTLLAPMPPFAPQVLPRSQDDLSVLRWSVRTDGHAGFIFVNNYVREASTPAHPQTRFAVALPGDHTEYVPQTPVDIPSGAYFAWPFGLDLAGVSLQYGTAQLMTHLSDHDDEIFVFACVHQVRCELVVDDPSVKLHTNHGLVVTHNGAAATIRKMREDDAEESISVQTKSGRTVCLLLLSPTAAANSWKVPEEGTQRLLRTEADVFSNGETVTLRQLGNATFRFAIYPKATTVQTGDGKVSLGANDEFAVKVPLAKVSVDTQILKLAGAVPPVKLGSPLSWRPVGVAQVPDNQTWADTAARWSIRVKPAGTPASVASLFLNIGYTGDAARLYTDGKLLDDNFFNGEPWIIGMNRFVVDSALPLLSLDVLPMRSDAPVYLPNSAQQRIAKSGQTGTLDNITIIPQYQLQILGQHAAK